MDVKQRILEGAGQLFIKEGIRRVTMDYIARKLGVSKRTIYELFTDKTELLKACLQHIMQENDARIEEVQNKSSNVLEVVIGALVYGSKAIKEISPVYFEDLEVHYPVLWQEIVNYKREESYQDFQALVNRGIKEGYFREGLNVKLVATIFIEQMNAMSRKEVFPPDLFPAAEVFETLFLNFIRGISTMEGIRVLEVLLESRKWEE
ncbi:TetR/AcrR family transcriptional regulator [Geofilum rubicundum]|uniref:Transcriptional regulator, TetR family n=1 Tax=Geofilum rubicundum JCM 15548 TaxID=1236989 RepID=A0A0E9M1A7_9BACT|nr:TetR/AcrR family transcriptional regulator [Geofilum rubicundum]GAO30905.1 transcriptional regulator, TetR family [Geofilum rubicundum JCM 15548]